MGGPPPPPYCGPRAKATSWRVQAGGSSAVRAFALAARAAPPNPSFMGENAPPALFRFRNDLRKAPGRSSRDVSVSAPASSPSIARSDLGSIAGRHPPSFAARRFSAPPHWASAGIWPDPRGIASGISLECGAYFALPGVTAAAHTVPPRACATCSFTNYFTLIVQHLALRRSRHPNTPNPTELAVLALRIAASLAIQPIIACNTAESALCAGGTATRRTAGQARAAPGPPNAWQSALPAPNGTAPPRISRRPWYGRDAPVPLAFEDTRQLACKVGRLPSVRRGCGPRTCAPRHTWASRRRDRPSCRRGRSCFWPGWACLSLAFRFFRPCWRLGS